tara:strand:+ start:3419 stop:4072 length:654 start_codon:yes stop_codon:yes gene_type:complete
MALLTAHMTKLQAVNQMLRSINEQPVSQLASGQLDASQAESVLDEVSRRAQSEGWHVNTRRNVVLTKNTDTQFAIPINVLSVDTADPEGWRLPTNTSYDKQYNVMMKRSADNSKWILYDIDKDTELWPDVTTLTVHMVELLEFHNLTPSLQIYVYKMAGHEFQKSQVASEVLYQFTKEDAQQAYFTAMQDDTFNEDRNVLRHNSAARYILQRHTTSY